MYSWSFTNSSTFSTCSCSLFCTSFFTSVWELLGTLLAPFWDRFWKGFGGRKRCQQRPWRKLSENTILKAPRLAKNHHKIHASTSSKQVSKMEPKSYTFWPKFMFLIEIAKCHKNTKTKSKILDEIKTHKNRQFRLSIWKKWVSNGNVREK